MTNTDKPLANDPEAEAIAAQQSGGAQKKDAADGLQNADHADQLKGHDKQEPAKPKD